MALDARIKWVHAPFMTTATETLRRAHTTDTIRADYVDATTVRLSNSLGHCWHVDASEWAARRDALITDGWR